MNERNGEMTAEDRPDDRIGAPAPPARRVLFVCAANVDRSPTAELLYRDAPGLEVRSAGMLPDAVQPITGELLAWADLVIAMEERHERMLRARFPEAATPVRWLGIPDLYTYMSAELITVLTRHLTPLLGPPACR